MPQPCTICTHPNRAEIDRLVVSGEPNQRVATKFGVTESAIRRHRAKHVPVKLAKAQAAQEVAEATSLLGEVHAAKDRGERLYQAAEDILAKALQAQDPRMALKAIAAAVDVMREARAHLELQGELTGELKGADGAIPALVLVVPAQVPRGEPAVRDLKVDAESRLLPIGAPSGEPPGASGEILDAEFESVPEGLSAPEPPKRTR